MNSTLETRSLRSIAVYAGPIPKLLAEDTVLDVCVNPDGSLWVNRLGKGFSREDELAASDSALLLSGIATVRDLNLNEKNPILETIFPLTGDRIEGLVPPIVTAPALAIRSRQKRVFSLDELEAAGIWTGKDDPLNASRYRDDFVELVEGKRHAEIIRLACEHRRNILIVGPTGSGKTSLANTLLSEIAQIHPLDRTVVIEDTPELQCSSPNHLKLLTTANITQGALVAASMRLIATRIIVGEMREDAAAKALISALNTGHRGGITTIHANDCLAGLRRLENLLGEHGRISRERISEAIDVVVFIDGERAVSAGRKVREVMLVEGLSEGGEYITRYV